MTMSHEVSEDFKAVVLEWLRERRPEAKSVVSVSTHGTDWAGDTEGGFHCETELTIRYDVGDPLRNPYIDVDGAELADLWNHVIRSWPR